MLSKKTVVPILLNETLIYTTMLNIHNDIIGLKRIFSFLINNNECLDCWFAFFEIDFFMKDIKVLAAEYQWFQNRLHKFKMMINNGKEPDFFAFKDEKEKDELMSTNLNNKKLKLKQKLLQNETEQDNILNSYFDSINILEKLEKNKKSIFFNFKSKIVNILTFCFYDMKKKIRKQIRIEKLNLRMQKEKLIAIGLKICDIKNNLEEVEKVIIDKNKQLSFEQKIINIKNPEVSTSASCSNLYL